MKKNILLSVLFLTMCLILTAQTGTTRITLNPSYKPFYHGVESGDPMQDHVIIWTRVTPDSGVVGNIKVYWQVATDVNFTNIVNYGTSLATEENQYCVKEDVCGLQPSTYYYFMFKQGERNSIIGRTKTAPSGLADNDSVRFAVVSCSSWEHGYFNAYQSISDRNDVDAVIHLGDYIYEYAAGGYTGNVANRNYDPATECITELDYELRYSQYKLDDQLRRIHQLFPFITVWDDHESANDSWREGAENHTPATEGNFIDRKRYAASTYFKWMPIRKPDPADTIRIFRTLRYGKLLDLIMLDTRLYDRDLQDLSETDNPNHNLLGPAERAWFLTQLSDTNSRWKIIGNQVMFAPLRVFGNAVNADQWDGYNYERQIVQNHVLNNNIKDVVVLTGDIHTSWCNDVPGVGYNANSGAGSVCVEFVGPSVTSANSPLAVGPGIIQSLNPHMKYINLNDHGYYTLDVTKTRAQADFTFVNTVSQLGSTDITGPSYKVAHNQRFLTQAASKIFAPQITAAIPPVLPSQSIGFTAFTDQYISINENTQAVVNVAPAFAACPAKSITIYPPAHGLAISLNGQDVTYNPLPNYNGYDTVRIVSCTADTLPVCDTAYLYITIIGSEDVDTTTVAIQNDSMYSACIAFDDLVGPALSIGFSQPLHGFVSLTDSCFIYTSLSPFSGTDVLMFTGCDAFNNCDTVVYVFKVNRPLYNAINYITLNKNTNTTFCFAFDDLIGPAGNTTVLTAANHGTFQLQGDSCVKYFPYFNFIGNDTMRFIACDTFGTNHCDTVTVIFTIQQPNSVQKDNMAVLGMYPNPVSNKLIIQYYLFEPGMVTIQIIDALGRIILASQINQAIAGLQYAQLNTFDLAKGNYIVEVKTDKTGYTKRIVKQ